jgi:hypothetical protein
VDASVTCWHIRFSFVGTLATFLKLLSEHRLVIIGETCICFATGTNFKFFLDCLVRTNRTSRIMLKIVNPNLFMCSLR